MWTRRSRSSQASRRGATRLCSSIGRARMAATRGSLCRQTRATSSTASASRSVVIVPLRLAWAITVHKSQGMSLPRLQVELGNPFAAGQCYVALSRAMEIDGLCINQYDRDETKIDYEAKRFHEAVSKGSMVEFEKRSHFWWCDVVNGLRHPAWVDVFKGHGNDGKGGTSFGSEFARWVAKYPVPENRKPLKAQAFTLPTQNGLALLPSSAPPRVRRPWSRSRASVAWRSGP